MSKLEIIKKADERIAPIRLPPLGMRSVPGPKFPFFQEPGRAWVPRPGSFSRPLGMPA